MDFATLLTGGAQPVVRDPVTAVVTRSDETGVWVSTEGGDLAHPIGPCRGFAEDAGVDVGTNVLLVWTDDGPWALVGGSPSGGFVTIGQLEEAIELVGIQLAGKEDALPEGGTADTFLDGTKNWAAPPGAFVHEQSFAGASTTWVIPHGQGTKALSVYTENSLGREIEGLVTYPDDDTIHVTFFHAQTGLARVWR